MKTTPTETDREAARLFEPAPGVRIWRAVCADTWSDPGIVIEVDPATSAHVGIRTERGWSWLPVCAIDTDDPATVGCMLAQVESALDAVGCPGACLHPWADGWAVRRGAAIRRYAGATKGAALVAAMKALKGAT